MSSRLESVSPVLIVPLAARRVGMPALTGAPAICRMARRKKGAALVAFHPPFAIYETREPHSGHGLGG